MSFDGSVNGVSGDNASYSNEPNEDTREKTRLLPSPGRPYAASVSSAISGTEPMAIVGSLTSLQSSPNSADNSALRPLHGRQVPARVRETKKGIIKRTPQLYANPAGSVSGGAISDYGAIEPASPNLYADSASVSASISRYKYYNKLAPFADTPFVMPDHVVPSNFFIVIPVKKGEGQSSIITIFSIWNTMMGTSLLAMPWALTQAGFAMGIAVILLMGILTFYTCYLTVRTTSTHPAQPGVVLDFSDLCEYYLGKAGKWICFVFSAIAFLGALIVFWVLMSNFLFNTGKYIHDALGNAPSQNVSNVTEICDMSNMTSHRPISYDLPPSDPPSAFDQIWDLQKTCPFWLLLIIFPLINLKSATFFTKFNVLGTVSIFYLLFFVTYHAFKWGPCVVLEPIKSSLAAIEFKWTFPALCGTLSLAMFIHNGIMAILRNQKKPQNNTRDLSIAYILVTVTYMYVGVIFYVTFPYLDKTLIPDNFLNYFAPNDVFAVIARVFLLIQMVAVFPLLMYILRIQVMHAFFANIWPSIAHVVIFNLVLLVICALVACFFPSVGTIIRYAGSACGLALIFTLPCLVLMLKRKEANQLTWETIVIHGFLIVIGVAIFVSQFLL